MSTNKTSSKLSVSSRPCDVAYRIKRVNELLKSASGFLTAIDPISLGGNVHKDLDNLLFRAQAFTKTATKSAPKKKIHKAKAKRTVEAVQVPEFTGWTSSTLGPVTEEVNVPTIEETSPSVTV
jgi:hypothetical protein